MTINRANLDENTHPGKDFYQYANGGWIKRNPLPDEFSRYGTFDALTEENNEKLRKLFEEIPDENEKPGSISEKVRNFYHTGMDTERIEKEGISPLQKYFLEIDSLSNIAGLKSLLARWQSKNIQLLFSIYGVPDKKDSGMMIASISQGGLGLTDVEYYLATDEYSKNIRKQYLIHIVRILDLFGTKRGIAESESLKILEFETRLAKSSMSRLERRDPFKTYNKIIITELINLCPEYNWLELFEYLKLERISEINVSQLLFFKEVSKVISETDIETWKIWLRWSLVNNFSDLLSSEFVNASFEFYGAFLSGKKIQKPRWKRVLANCNYALGEGIGRLFVARYFPPESKNKMLVLVSNLKVALAERIRNLDWMSESTKLKALEKLEAIRVKIGYPDRWRDYNELEVGNESYFENVISASIFNFEYFIKKIGYPVDKDEWGMTPQTVNAYYNPSRNEIVFPAAILQPPFFYPDADDAVNYGAIGMVIGHELTHGFDDQGRNYDKDGNLANWWTDEDTEKFNLKAKEITDQFDNYKVMDTLNANGKLTLGENIADLGGLNISYTALLKAWETNPPGISSDGFTPAQRFFLSFAHVWANNINDEERIRRTKEDVHSLGHLRVNGSLRNIREFYEAFQVYEGDPMFTPSENQVIIW